MVKVWTDGVYLCSHLRSQAISRTEIKVSNLLSIWKSKEKPKKSEKEPAAGLKKKLNILPPSSPKYTRSYYVFIILERERELFLLTLICDVSIRRCICEFGNYAKLGSATNLLSGL